MNRRREDGKTYIGMKCRGCGQGELLLLSQSDHTYRCFCEECCLHQDHAIPLPQPREADRPSEAWKLLYQFAMEVGPNRGAAYFDRIEELNRRFFGSDGES
jgi:hypothetical protein